MNTVIAVMLSAGVALAASSASAQQTYFATNIGDFGGGATVGFDINNHGQVVGYSFALAADASDGLQRRAFLYDPTIGIQAVGGSTWNQWGYETWAENINDAGQMAITQSYLMDESFPHIRDPNIYVSTATSFEDVRQLNGDGVGESYLRGMDESGTLWGVAERVVRYGTQYANFVGNASFSGLTFGPNEEPNTYNEGISFDSFVNTVDPLALTFDISTLNLGVSLLGGATITSVRDINLSGLILAQASDGYAYVLTPIPEPATYALLLAGLAAVAGAARRKVRCGAASRGASDQP